MVFARPLLIKDGDLTPDSSFAFEIDFIKSSDQPSRVFAATYSFIRACEFLDAELVRSIDPNIRTILILENIEVGSIRTRLRTALQAIDDDALKTLDWRPAVGKYIVRAKHKVLSWIDNDNAPRNLPDLRRELQQLASETDVRHLPDYSPPSSLALIEAIGAFDDVKGQLLPGDKATFISPDGSVELSLTKRISIEDLESLAIADITKIPAAEMILPVKKPDYLGKSQWELRHGNRIIYAKINDAEWLHEFQTRKIDVRPGDSLKCQVEIEYWYGHDHELIAEKYTVIKVSEVLINRTAPNGELFE